MEPVRGKLIRVRMGNATGVAYVNYGDGRSPELTQVDRRIKDLELSCGSTAVALRTAAKGNPFAEASPRFTIKAIGGEPSSDCDLRGRFCACVEALCGRVDVDMMAPDAGANARGPACRPPSNSASEGPSPGGRMRRFL